MSSMELSIILPFCPDHMKYELGNGGVRGLLPKKVVTPQSSQATLISLTCSDPTWIFSSIVITKTVFSLSFTHYMSL